MSSEIPGVLPQPSENPNSPIEQLRDINIETNPFALNTHLENPLVIDPNSVDEHILALLTSKPTHDLLGRGFVNLLQNYEVGKVKIVDPYLDGILSNLIKSEDADEFNHRFPEMLATYFMLSDDVKKLEASEQCDKDELAANKKVLLETQKLIQDRMANLTDRNYLSSERIFPK